MVSLYSPPHHSLLDEVSLVFDVARSTRQERWEDAVGMEDGGDVLGWCVLQLSSFRISISDNTSTQKDCNFTSMPARRRIYCEFKPQSPRLDSLDGLHLLDGTPSRHFSRHRHGMPSLTLSSLSSLMKSRLSRRSSI